MQPSVLTMAFNVPDGSSTIDISQCASILNRRFYRQGIQWAVAGFRVFTPIPVEAANKGILISRLPSTWTMGNSWEKAFSFWNRQQREALESAESAAARFRDFKIHMDAAHVDGTFANNLVPIDASSNTADKGEWEESQIVVPNIIADASGSTVDPFEYKLHAVGVNNHAGSRGIIDGYAQSRAYPQSPDPAIPVVHNDTNWFKQMFDVGNDDTEILQNATAKNDDLPYDQDEYPGATGNLPGLQVVDAAYFSAGTNSNKLFLKGDTFPCGLVRVVSSAGLVTQLLIDLIPGNHKGYLCSPMSEM